MAKSFSSILLPISIALCLSYFLSIATATPRPMYAEGKVFCDNCRVEFITKLSRFVPGSTVKLECRSRTNMTLSYAVEGTTDQEGVYRLPVEGDHEEDICEVKLIKSGWENCTDIFNSQPEIARVLLTNNVGVLQASRFVNPLGFKTAKAVEGCADVLQQLGFLPIH
ncbi:Pollen Ole e 1 allergen and extensin family protein [Euphorbia peplus]|nr:Pollen Ole e 1 allergen and extensin family protein [Euphorbia peplus]